MSSSPSSFCNLLIVITVNLFAFGFKHCNVKVSFRLLTDLVTIFHFFALMPHLCLGLARDLTAAGDAFVVGDVFVVVMVVVISASVISVVSASFAENVEFNDMVLNL